MHYNKPGSLTGELAGQHEVGWDHPWTARQYESFYRRHRRYRHANRALVEHAALAPGQRVLDFAAGTGRTAEAALPYLDGQGFIHCVEPAGAMRQLGQARLSHSIISWSAALPPDPAAFDRILCGAAIWQVDSLEQCLIRLATLLKPGGALCFNIPALYLGLPDEPGEGDDPRLLALLALLQEDGLGGGVQDEPRPPLAVQRVEQALSQSRLRPESWSFRLKLTQAALRDWLKLPVLTNRLMAGLDPDERVRRIEAAYKQVPHDSWRWERWLGWTAWRA